MQNLTHYYIEFRLHVHLTCLKAMALVELDVGLCQFMVKISFLDVENTEGTDIDLASLLTKLILNGVQINMKLHLTI